MRLAIAALLALGCQVAPNPPVECRVVLSPDASLAEVTAVAAERWQAATGCSIELGEGGVRVELALSILRPDGTEAPGATSEARDRVRVNMRVRGAARARTVLHELGHALGGNHCETGGVLSGEPGYEPVIDALSLADVCSHLPCTAFIPEGP